MKGWKCLPSFKCVKFPRFNVFHLECFVSIFCVMKQILEGSQESRGMSLMKRIHNKQKINRNGIKEYIYTIEYEYVFELEGRFNASKFHVLSRVIRIVLIQIRSRLITTITRINDYVYAIN